MGTDFSLNRGKETVFFGRLYNVLNNYDMKQDLFKQVEEEIKNIEFEKQQHQSKIQIFVSYKPASLDDLENTLKSTEDIFLIYDDIVFKLGTLYQIRNLLEEGWQIEINE